MRRSQAKNLRWILVLSGILAAQSLSLIAQTADQAWLDRVAWHGNPGVPLHARALGDALIVKTAADELNKGLSALYGASSTLIQGNATGEILVGTADQLRAAYPFARVPAHLAPDAYWISSPQGGDRPRIVIAGGDERGALYGAFALIRELNQSNQLPQAPLQGAPAMPIRWTDEWDNADGSIERGYAGRSIFFEGGKVRDDLAPVAEYARLLASVGINGANLNNVNNAAPFLEPAMLQGIARVASAMRPWGVRVALSVDIASPQKIGGLTTYDPLDPAVQRWWQDKVAEIYALIPDFAGFTVKADSEGQPGPASYGRTPADAANVLARALAPHGGIVLYRAFVYNHHLDWRDPHADRARAAYDIFHPLDGKFAPNVVVQTKYGPIDFQVREPVSPVFAGLPHTSQAMELQITQEYLGQQRHLVYLAPMWRQILDTDMRAGNVSTPVRSIVSGAAFHQPLGGMVGVSGVGREAWLGSPLALANLYAFGRLAWDPTLSAEQIALEWIEQTISREPRVVSTVEKMLMQSWPAYEDYTGPLGLQTLTDITGSHYGPNIEASERNGWGQWHRADHDGVGMDRSVATGTGYAGQYPPQLAQIFEDEKKTPDDLLLFFHHVPYTYNLHNGSTVIQYLYDSHYRGAAQAAQFVREWESLKGRIDPALYTNMLARLEYQASHAIVWRDAVTQYFLKLSGIPDAKGRAGHYPGRYEAEDAKLSGYTVVDVTPWEDASRGKAVTCAAASCSAEWIYSGAAGRFNIAAQYFDLPDGIAHFTLSLDGQQLVGWAADGTFPTSHPHGDNSTRFIYAGPDSHGIALKPGDMIRIEGVPNGSDPAALDYIEVTPIDTQTSSQAKPAPAL